MILNARLARPSDLDKLKEIHFKHYKTFQFPRLEHFLNQYVIEDVNGEFITFGGLEVILEATCLTDLDKSVELRGAALRKLLVYLKMDADFKGFDQIHSFTTDPTWTERLRKEGFNDCKGTALYINT